MKRWKWKGRMDRIGSGVVEANTEEEALRRAKRALYTNGAPDHEIDIEEIAGEDDDEEEEDRIE